MFFKDFLRPRVLKHQNAEGLKYFYNASGITPWSYVICDRGNMETRTIVQRCDKAEIYLVIKERKYSGLLLRMYVRATFTEAIETAI